MLKKYESWKIELKDTELEERKFPDYKRYTHKDLDKEFKVMVIADNDHTGLAESNIKEMSKQAEDVDMFLYLGNLTYNLQDNKGANGD